MTWVVKLQYYLWFPLLKWNTFPPVRHIFSCFCISYTLARFISCQTVKQFLQHCLLPSSHNSPFAYALKSLTTSNQISESHLLFLSGLRNVLIFWPDRNLQQEGQSLVNRVTMLLEKVGDVIPESHRVKRNTTLPLPGRLGHSRSFHQGFWKKDAIEIFCEDSFLGACWYSLRGLQYCNSLRIWKTSFF